MYHTLALAMPEHLQKKDGEDEEAMETDAFDEGTNLAADEDLAADDDLMADEDLADDDDLAADEDGEEHLPVPKFKFGSGLKIAGFAR